jgi:hypothetical protein
VTRLRSALRRLGGFALLPLSVVPILGVVPVIADSHDVHRRLQDFRALPAPAVTLTPAERARFRPPAPFRGAVPVLVYHGIGTGRGAVSRAAFARQMALLRHAGFEAIGLSRYARFRRGESTGLPARPVLVTIDDARLAAYRNTDAVLARERMRATMAVSGRPISRGDLSFLTWKELHAMVRSGRWDVQADGFDAHRVVAADASGAGAPFLATQRYLRSTGPEPFADYQERVSRDVFATRRMLREQGLAASTFAVPYGDLGRGAGRDPRIAPFLTSLLEQQFGTYFVQAAGNDPRYTRPGTGAAERYEVHAGTTLDALYGWLVRHAPAVTEAPPLRAHFEGAVRR